MFATQEKPIQSNAPLTDAQQSILRVMQIGRAHV